MHAWSQLIIGMCRYLTASNKPCGPVHPPTYTQKPYKHTCTMSVSTHPPPHTASPTPTCVHTVLMSKYLEGLTVGNCTSVLTIVVCTVYVKDAFVVLSGRTTGRIVDANGRPFWSKPMTRNTHKAHITPVSDRLQICNHITAHSTGH